ncbi:putative transmembrane protein [Phenylobacterium zucineum HLK1]|uniref:Putative transmembrane protein n=1 Tax=Phenylobacterium zucineum (strain HLK1) TaxID=450851 RepID=B4RHI9_PHEZH|nr:YfiR family protein [Phenylobacterium zucineum]ACG77449.1 putative transmembrane protein [Phenylobacterium zucineum HLK1]
MGAPARTRLAAAALAAAALAPAAAGAQPLETQVKAAFLAKFAAFASWPPGVLETAPALRICVVGRDPFAGALERASRSQTVSGRPLAVVRMAEVDRGSGCHVMYASGSDRQSAAQALAAVRGQPVLTVTDAARGGARGMIHFVVFEERVRFYVDLAEAQRSGLGLSSKLLSVALTVKR